MWVFNVGDPVFEWRLCVSTVPFVIAYIAHVDTQCVRHGRHLFSTKGYALLSVAALLSFSKTTEHYCGWSYNHSIIELSSENDIPSCHFWCTKHPPISITPVLYGIQPFPHTIDEMVKTWLHQSLCTWPWSTCDEKKSARNVVSYLSPWE